MKAARIGALLLMVMLSAAHAGGQIAVGQAAPALRFTKLLHAAPGARTDWPALRGKVVVLEFWATWCPPCIAQIPHLNSITRSVGSDRVQFIAVDDEPAETVERFVARIPISGWLGIDTTGKTLRAYGADSRPRTVVVDATGRIAAILDPTQLTGAALLNLAAGKKVEFPRDVNESPHRQALKDAAKLDALAAASGDALVDISVRRGDPNGQSSAVDNSPPGGALKLDVVNMPVQALTGFMGLPLDRVRIQGFPQGRYSLHVEAPRGTTLEDLGPAIQLAVAQATHLHLVRTNEEEDVWVVQGTPKMESLLQPAESGKGRRVCMYERDTRKLILERCSPDQVAKVLEIYLGMPVMNEAGGSGEFSAIVGLDAPGAEGVRSAIEENLGLTLVRARRRVERVTFAP